MTDAIQFRATIPGILSAIKVDGSGGMRVQFDVAETEMAQAVKLLAMRQAVLLVTVEADNGYGKASKQDGDNDSAGNRPLKRSTAKRRK
jgi:hypothetical protein